MNGNGNNSQKQPVLKWIQGKLTAPSKQRLDQQLPIFETDLNSINCLKENKENGWWLMAEELRKKAVEANLQGEYERGWQCLKAADRFRLHGLDTDQLLNKARAILNEAQDEKKGLTKWRQKTIIELLKDLDKSPQDASFVTRVVEAKRILDEHQDNVYFKHSVVNTRLALLSFAGALWIVVWLVSSLWMKSQSFDNSPEAALFSNQEINPFHFWVMIILAGILGSLISAFTSIVGTNSDQKSIPQEISGTTLTFSRLVVAALSAVAVTFLMASGFIVEQPPSFQLFVLLGIVSGFSDRLLIKGLEKIA